MKYKIKIISALIAVILAFNLCVIGASAEESTAMHADEAQSAILIDGISGKVLFEKDCDKKMAPASITKIMTLLLVMEAIDSGKISLDDNVTCSPHANSMGGSQIWLEVGEIMTVDELLRATAISSANDAAVALGEFISGSEEAFVAEMNKRAQELGMKNTCFKNATGLDAEGHETTARDIAIMSMELLKHEKIKNYSTVWMDTLRGGKTSLVNTNKLIRFYDGATGLKTGTTDSAGHCLSATAEKNGLSLIAVALGAKTGDERFAVCRRMLDYGFANWEVVTPKPSDEKIEPVKVLFGVEGMVDVVYGSAQPVVIKKGDKDKITYKTELCPDIMAPVEKGQRLGVVNMYVGESKIGEYGIFSAAEVKRLDFGCAFVMIVKEFLSLK